MAREEVFQKAAEAPAGGRLDSWKEIAAYLKRDVRTVQRWEKTEGLPVHRHLHSTRGSIYAYKPALDEWWLQRRPRLEGEGAAPAGLHLAAGPQARTGKKKLVVLPFDNLSGDAEQDYFSEGLTEEMITELSRIDPERLGVIARSTAMHYRGTSKRADQIARELGADFILEGSVRRAGDRVRISAQLIQATDQTHLWAETYERTSELVLDIQTEVAERIARSLELELLPGKKAELARRSSRSSIAHDTYLRGRYFWNRRTEQGFRKAIGFFQKTVEQDPSYALGYVGLADCFVTLGWYGAFPAREAYERAQSAAEKALAIDERLAEAHTSLGYAKLLYQWDWAEIESEHRRALELDPSYVTGRHWYGLFLAAMGRSEEAVEQMRLALELDPLSLVLTAHLGWVYYHDRQFDRAIEELEKARDMDPHFPVARYFLALAYAQARRRKDAVTELEISTKLTGGHPGWLATLGHAYGLAGKKTEARKCLRELEEMARHRHVPAYFPAFTCAGIGDKEAAFHWLEKALEERSGWLVYLNVEAGLDGLRSDPRFSELVRRVGLPRASS